MPWTFSARAGTVHICIDSRPLSNSIDRAWRYTVGINVGMEIDLTVRYSIVLFKI